MIQGRSALVYRLNRRLKFNRSFQSSIPIIGKESIPPVYISKNLWDKVEAGDIESKELVRVHLEQLNNKLKKQHPGYNDSLDFHPDVPTAPLTQLHVDVNIVENDVLDIEAFKKSRPDLAKWAEFICEPDGRYIVGAEVEKMSKSKYNVVNPDTIADKYGADVLRLYEMFLGPLEQAKPWNTNGIDGTFRFIRKLWRLFYKDNAEGKSEWIVTDEAPTPAELKVLHKTIKKAQEDIEHYSFNTSVSAFMVCVNELSTLKCHKKAILQDVVLLLSPYAPHICEELWAALGHEPGTVSKASYPVFDAKYLVEDAFEYPIQINGKVRTTISFAIDRAASDIEKEVLANEIVQKWLDGKAPKKVVVVPKRIVNVVL